MRLNGISRRRRSRRIHRLLPIGGGLQRSRLRLERLVGVDLDALRFVRSAVVAADDVVAEEEADGVRRRFRYVDPELRRWNKFGDGTRFATVDESGARVGSAGVGSRRF